VQRLLITAASLSLAAMGIGETGAPGSPLPTALRLSAAGEGSSSVAALGVPRIRRRGDAASDALLIDAASRPTAPLRLEREARRAGQQGVLRVCADPNDMPASNDKREGFANKIAELIAKDLGDTITYQWWPSRRGYIRNTLRAGNCDVVIDVPAQYELVAASKSYYRSTYVIVTRRDQHMGITGLDDPRLKTLKIGVNSIGDNYTQTPPADALSSRGISANLVWFTTFYDDEHRPGDIVNAVADGKVDVAVVWGPLGGYYAKHAAAPLDVTMLPDSDAVTGKQFAFDQALGVRRSDRELLAKLNESIDRRRADISAILNDYGVPIAGNGTR
jgi:mxaJ protein